MWEMITNAVQSGHGTAARTPSGKGCQVVYGRSVQKNDRVRANTGAGLCAAFRDVTLAVEGGHGNPLPCRITYLMAGPKGAPESGCDQESVVRPLKSPTAEIYVRWQAALSDPSRVGRAGDWQSPR